MSTCAVSHDLNNYINDEYRYERIVSRFPSVGELADDLSDGLIIEIGDDTYTAEDAIEWMCGKEAKVCEEFDKKIAKAICQFATTPRNSSHNSYLDRELCAYFHDVFCKFAEEKLDKAIDKAS